MFQCTLVVELCSATSTVVHFRLWNGAHKDEARDLNNPDNKGANDNEHVETVLPFGHGVRGPVGHPISHPEEITNESESEQNHHLGFVVLKTDYSYNQIDEARKILMHIELTF